MTNPITILERKRLVLLAVLTALAVALPATSAAANVANPDPELIVRWEPCEANTGVTVIVDDQNLGEGKIYVGCALGAQPDGVAALEHAGFGLEGTENYGLAFICRIDGEPTPAEHSCKTTPGAGAYWSYWRGKSGGRWGYSHFGAASPESGAPVNSVEGWSFGSGGAPRIQPMNASGPSSFSLPPEQASSVIPARLASSWLASTLDETAEEAEAQESKKLSEHVEPELALRGAIVLAQAGVADTALRGVVGWLARSGEEKGATVEGIPLREYLSVGESPAHQAARLALAVLGLQALGQNPADFAGMNLRATLEGRIEKAGQLKSEGEASEAVEVTAPTVLALARTGTLSAKAQKTLALIIAKQEASGSFGLTSIDVEAVEALVAARELGASTIGQSELETVEAALARAGSYLESIQEADGGVRKGEGDEPDVESTALGAVGLTLTGRPAASERAARWSSRYQVTAEYAGEGNLDAGEHTPAEDLIGAFLPSEALLRNALASGLTPSPFGVFYDAQRPTIDALAALVTAGPYGPYDASFDQQLLFFENRTVGSPSGALTATLTNDDVRPITIAEVSLAGAQAGDFTIRGGTCAGGTLAPGESCEVSVSFGPTTTGEREALLHATVKGTSQTIELPLAGTGVAATPPPSTEPEHHSEPERHAEQQLVPTGPSPQPPGEGAHQAEPTGSVAAFKSTRTVARARIATIAVLRCAQGPRCTVDAPSRVRVRIAGSSYWAAVLAPRVLSAGQHATLAVRLSQRAYAALAGHTATITLTVTLGEQGGARTTRTVRVVIAHASSKAARAHRATSVHTPKRLPELYGPALLGR
jgi:hypothetical protein